MSVLTCGLPQENVIDVDEDDVLIIDGLTKRFRLPGWRVAWILGPKEFIKASVATSHNVTILQAS